MLLNELEKDLQECLLDEKEEKVHILFDKLLKNKSYKLLQILLSQFSTITNFKYYQAEVLYNLQEYEKAYDLYYEMNEYKKSMKCVSKSKIIKDRYSFYPKNIIENLKNKNTFGKKITLVMTTCKRFALFEKTINSFLNCCLDIDLIGDWFCVDDNSSFEDREKMINLYPFITFYFKDADEKGHPESLNIILERMTTPYFFLLEDDWCFFQQKNYLTLLLEILSNNDIIGQMLINRNYSETETRCELITGIKAFSTSTNNNFEYYIQEHYTNEEEKIKYFSKYGNISNSGYWGHFSLRPGLHKLSVYKQLGCFSLNSNHFEMEFCERYARNYITAFLPSVYCVHTGKLTNETNNNKPNAYFLNDEQQFTEKKVLKPEREIIVGNFKLRQKFSLFYINLDKRTDKNEKFLNQDQLVFRKILNHDLIRISGIDGKLLKKENRQLQQIFDNSHYKNQSGAVGCALTHIQLYINLINESDEESAYIILEDDAVLCKNFELYFNKLLKKLPNNYDILYFGHHNKIPQEKGVEKKDLIFQLKLAINSTKSLAYSYGGTFGYIISKNGARKLLNYINKNSMIACVDTMAQYACDEMNTYYCEPNLVYSVMNDVSSDINIYDKTYNLYMSVEERVNMELEYFKKNGIECLEIPVEDFLTGLEKHFKKNRVILIKICFKDNIVILEKLKTLKNYYTFENSVIFIYNNCVGEFYKDRLKIDNVYNITNSIEYIFVEQV